MEVLHVYGQQAQHDDVMIVGTKRALQMLRDRLTVVIENNAVLSGSDSDGKRDERIKSEENTCFFVNDGEGFYCRIRMVDGNLAGKLNDPYSAEYLAVKRGGIPPEIL